MNTTEHTAPTAAQPTAEAVAAALQHPTAERLHKVMDKFDTARNVCRAAWRALEAFERRASLVSLSEEYYPAVETLEIGIQRLEAASLEFDEVLSAQARTAAAERAERRPDTAAPASRRIDQQLNHMLDAMAVIQTVHDALAGADDEKPEHGISDHIAALRFGIRELHDVHQTLDTLNLPGAAERVRMVDALPEGAMEPQARAKLRAEALAAVETEGAQS